LSCKFNNYETIEKNKRFRDDINTGNFIELNDGYTYYEIKNEDSIPTLVFVHGFSVPSYIWDTTFNSSVELGFKSIKIDLYGRGFSSNPDTNYTDELFANQVLELLNKLNISNASFLGLSNGGRVISKIAYLKPEIVDKLIYVSSNSFMEYESVAEKSVSGKEINKFITNNYPIISKGQLKDFKNPEKFNYWADDYEDLLKYKGFAKALISTRKNHVNQDKENIFINNSKISYYTIWGDSDSVVVYSNFKEKLNKLMTKRNEFFISNSGHLPHMENIDEFENILFDRILKD
tara:strand:- start:1582 stop:2454 length:873 start_codon:yes stop_codon:yes gene_type:complete